MPRYHDFVEMEMQMQGGGPYFSLGMGRRGQNLIRLFSRVVSCTFIIERSNIFGCTEALLFCTENSRGNERVQYVDTVR